MKQLKVTELISGLILIWPRYKLMSSDIPSLGIIFSNDSNYRNLFPRGHLS
jgi:hypothetical protein